MDYDFNFSVVWRNWDILISGLGLGLGLAFISILIGCVIGIICAFMMLSKNRFFKYVSSIYVTIIRNTPILVLILFTYFALPQMGIRIGKIESFIITLSIYAGAYLTEVFRSGLTSISKGLYEAGLAIGLTPLQIKRMILVPIMIRNILPSLTNNFISLFKDTSLAAAISIPELTFYARKINVESFRVIETWMVTSGIYIIVCFLLGYALRVLEKKITISKTRKNSSTSTSIISSSLGKENC
ncbi:amino acid ABC transporter permease [Vibrio spartinae]|uniref:Glutamine transport system permease protein GlnP n=1 Tax=Vibrio spartinae TaxID=1918945 RepID=A0A1N6M7W4_9VIBR|nr:Glutamine transport system permease protein GlnP [Vibrio spartinae]